MSRLFIEGWESGQNDLWDSSGGSPAVVAAVTGMNGTYCLSLPVVSFLEKTLAAADEYYVAFKYKPTTVGAGGGVPIYFKNGATVLGCLALAQTTLYLQAYSGDKAVLLATSLTPLSLSGVYLIEIRYKPHDSAGIFQVKVNGIQTISFAGDTTAAALQVDTIRLGWSAGVTAANYDDVVVDDGAWIGNTAVQGVFPNAIGNSSQWTPSAGDNYSCVDERPVSAADYVATNAVDQLDTYGGTNLSGVIANIKGVQVQATCIQEGAPTPLNLKLAIRSAGVDYLSGDQAVPAVTAKAVSHVWENNPLDASVWLEAEINALEIGMKSAA